MAKIQQDRGGTEWQDLFSSPCLLRGFFFGSAAFANVVHARDDACVAIPAWFLGIEVGNGIDVCGWLSPCACLSVFTGRLQSNQAVSFAQYGAASRGGSALFCRQTPAFQTVSKPIAFVRAVFAAFSCASYLVGFATQSQPLWLKVAACKSSNPKHPLGFLFVWKSTLLRLVVVDAHQHAEHDHDGQSGRTAIADQRQRHTHHRQNAAYHAHVDEGITKERHGKGCRDGTLIQSAGTGADDQAASDDEYIQNHQYHVANQAEFLAKHGKNKVGGGFWYVIQMGLSAIEPTFTPHAA